MIHTIRKFIDQHLAPSPADGHRHSVQQLQLATAGLLLEMARADYQVHSQELDMVLQALRDTFDLSDLEGRELLALAEAQAQQMTSFFPITTQIKSAFGQDEKIKIIELMWQVAFSDGRIDRYEEHLIRKIAGLIYVTREEIVAAKHRAEKSRDK